MCIRVASYLAAENRSPASPYARPFLECSDDETDLGEGTSDDSDGEAVDCVGDGHTASDVIGAWLQVPEGEILGAKAKAGEGQFTSAGGRSGSSGSGQKGRTR